MNDLQQIFNIQYNLVYYAVSFVALLLIIEFYYRNINTSKIQKIILFFLLVGIILLFGFRTEMVGTDTPRNIKYFVDSYSFTINSFSEVKDIGLYAVSKFIAKLTSNVDIFLTVLAILYIGPIYIGINNLKLKNPLIFFFFLFSFFFFKSMGINIQRQGIAFALFFCGITYNLKDKNFISYVLYALAFVFHASIIIPIVVFFVSKKIKAVKIPLLIYLLSTGLSLVNFNFYGVLEQIPIINILVEERFDGYLNIDEEHYRIGFRPDFWFFNTIFLFIGYYTYRNIKKLSVNIEFYKTIFFSYIFTSSFFFLMFSYGFSDRYGVLSWIFIPFLLLPYVDYRKKIGLFNVIILYLVCLTIATIFKFI